MTKFRPCIDLHEGVVKQIVGGTLDRGDDSVVENFVSERPAEYFAERYAEDNLTGGHVIMLGKGNEEAARAALAAYPGGLQIGGGITVENAAQWLETGASQVIATSTLFDPQDGHFLPDRLEALVAEIGAERLVLDLSCRREAEGWQVAMKRWTQPAGMWVTKETLSELASSCSEFLIHAADVEGKCEGIDEDLVRSLSEWSPLPTTYAGGARGLDDLSLVDDLSGGRIDLTIGSALDIFGGSGARYEACVDFNKRA